LARMFSAEFVPSAQSAHGKGLKAMRTVRLTQREIDQVIEFMHQSCGNDFSDKESLVASKMSVLCGQLDYQHFYQLWDDMQGTTIAAAHLRHLVIDELTTSYSYFYREDSHFALLTKLISEGKLPAYGSELRLWSAGCASGEEAYNLAMTVEEARRGGLFAGPYHVVGSDISEHAIEDAVAGLYDVVDVSRMPPHWRTQYCMRSGSGYEVKSQLRDHVEFRCENVLSPRPDTPFDVVMCRNMMIYFDNQAIDQFRFVLQGRVKPGGYLFLGHAEILNALPGFTYVEPSLWRRDAGGSDLLSLIRR